MILGFYKHLWRFNYWIIFVNVDIRSDISIQNKLNVNAPEFTINREVHNNQPHSFFSQQFIQHSKSSGNIQQQIQQAIARRHAAGLSIPQTINNQTILVSHPLQLQQLNFGVLQSQIPAADTPSNEAQMNVRHFFLAYLIYRSNEHFFLFSISFFLSLEDCFKGEVCWTTRQSTAKICKPNKFESNFSAEVKVQKNINKKLELSLIHH